GFGNLNHQQVIGAQLTVPSKGNDFVFTITALHRVIAIPWETTFGCHPRSEPHQPIDLWYLQVTTLFLTHISVAKATSFCEGQSRLLKRARAPAELVSV